MIVKKNDKKSVKANKKSVKACGDSTIILDMGNFVADGIDTAPDYCRVRDDVKCIIEYLATFEDDAFAKEVVGDLAYIYANVSGKCDVCDTCCDEQARVDEPICADCGESK